MFRNLFLLIFLALGLAVLLRLVLSIARGVKQLLGLGGREEGEGRMKASEQEREVSGHFVRDPESGTYVDQRLAIKEVIGGETFYFESNETRDAYLSKERS